MTIHFILGGVRSGKSRYGEDLILGNVKPESSKKPLYIATAQALDEKMAARIATHQERRKDYWDLIEAPFDLANRITSLKPAKPAYEFVMIDCMTLYLTNYLINHYEQWPNELNALLQALKKHHAHFIIISNETNFSLHAMDELSRNFQDEAGLMHQKIANIADWVTLMVAGIPHSIKKPS